MIVGLAAGDAHIFEFYGYCLFRLFDGETGELLGVDEFAALAEIVALFEGAFRNIPAVDYLKHGNVVSDGVFKVALVVARNSHNRTRAVACENEIADENGDFPAIYGVYRVYAFKDAAALRLVELGAVHIGFLDCFFNIRFYLILILYAGHKLLNEVAVGSENHKGNAVDGFDAGGVN